MEVTLKGGVKRQFTDGMTVYDIAKEVSEGLARAACCGVIGSEAVDLRSEVTDGAELTIATFDDEQGKRAFNHTAAHILAQAVKRLYPQTKLAIGPAIDNGFYYDFDRDEPFSDADLEKIEAEMKKIVKENIAITRKDTPREQAIDFVKAQGEIYKQELIEELPDNAVITFYTQGEFTDLCAGPHLMSTKAVKAFKLTSVAGAYWRGSEKNKMLSRIYGTAFTKAADLAAYLEMLEEAKKRDHRRLGKELELFALLEEGPGFPFFMPKGMTIKNTLMEHWRNVHTEAGYDEISTPIILNRELWLNSGHWDHYRDNMYSTNIDEQIYCVKPMNCPGAILLYKQNLHSYRELPIRSGELGLVHRHEKSGALHGLMRVRCFTQDDAHIFMLPEQIKDEINGVYNLIDEMYSLFGFTYNIELSTRPEDSMGSDEDWEMATSALKSVLDEKGVPYVINEGDGAFYGPKIDFHLNDSIGRTWQCGTIQLDFQMPERFDLTYTAADGSKKRPVMIHTVTFGSTERFIGILIEHFAGAFPMWLSPLQVKVLPISEKYHGYADSILKRLTQAGIKAQADYRAEKIGYKIRDAQLKKVNYMIIAGEKEELEGSVSVRSRKDGDIGSMRLDGLIEKLLKEIAEKAV